MVTSSSAMPWNETDPMNERVKSIAACLARDESAETFAERCECFGITAKSGYKWIGDARSGDATFDKHARFANHQRHWYARVHVTRGAPAVRDPLAARSSAAAER